VVDVSALDGRTGTEILRVAAAIETRSEHPVARAIVAAARARGSAIPPASNFQAVPGMGAEGDVDGVRVAVGNARLFQSGPLAAAVAATGRENADASTVYVSMDGTLAGAILLQDRARDTAREAIGMLREQGIRHIVMLTGDHRRVAERVARELQVDEHHGELLPDEKHAIVRSLKARGPVLMVGDGINDAPALAAADVGVAMGAAGSDAALETADVALMSDELLRLPYAIRLARATMWNVRMNVAISLALKAAFLAMAVAGTATLWMAVLADTGATVIVVGNALRLLRAR
jgi:Cd2+/Zn2+-exporting ATPase